MTFREYLAMWSQLHGSATPTGLVRIWLRCAFFLTTPLVRLNPNWITGSALLVMAAAIWLVSGTNPQYALAGVMIFAVGLIDSFDGMVAVRSSRISSWGAFLDAIVDRFIDVGVGFIFVALGAPIVLVLVTLSIALIHEYLRARAGGLGHHEVGVVTIAEKPTRIALAVMFLFACAARPSDSQLLAVIGVTVWLILGIFGFVHLMRTYRAMIK